MVQPFTLYCKACKDDHQILSLSRITRVPPLLRRGHDYKMPPDLQRLRASDVLVTRRIDGMMLDGSGHRTYLFAPIMFHSDRHSTETIALAVAIYREAGWVLDEWCSAWERSLEGKEYHNG